MKLIPTIKNICYLYKICKIEYIHKQFNTNNFFLICASNLYKICKIVHIHIRSLSIKNMHERILSNGKIEKFKSFDLQYRLENVQIIDIKKYKQTYHMTIE